MGGTNLLFTMAALVIIDHFGRRRLMIVGSMGYIQTFELHRLGVLQVRRCVRRRGRAVSTARDAGGRDGRRRGRQRPCW